MLMMKMLMILMLMMKIMTPLMLISLVAIRFTVPADVSSNLVPPLVRHVPHTVGLT